MTDGTPRPRPDGSAWRKAQQDVAARNDAARKRGREERVKAERKEAVNRAGAAQRGIYR
jgi:hypothetical protein